MLNFELSEDAYRSYCDFDYFEEYDKENLYYNSLTGHVWRLLHVHVHHLFGTDHEGHMVYFYAK